MEFRQERIATLHDIADPRPDVSLERVAVVVPIMGTDLARTSVEHVLSELATVNPGRVVLSVRADHSELLDLHRQVDRSGLDADLLWCNAPAVERLLSDVGIASSAGKGRDVWLGMAVAEETHDIVVVHDADSRDYSGKIVQRLAWPIEQGFTFAKGYYARIEQHRFYGRLVRLVWWPLIHALREHSEAQELVYLDAFRYPLAGEFAIDTEVVTALSLYPQWGLEAGMLGRMYDHAGLRGSAQVDLGLHRHDHRPVRGEDGLARMASGVVGALFAEVERHGIPVDPEDIARSYERIARGYVDRYENDAAFNRLEYDRDDEIAQVRSYGAAIASGGTNQTPLPPIGEIPVSAAEILKAGRSSAERTGTRRPP